MQFFNIAEQGPFPVTIEDFSSRNVFLLRSIGLPPVSNVHPLSVTDLLQWEDCCCYKREGLLKMINTDRRKRDSTDTLKRSSKLFQRSQLLVVKFLRAIQFKCKRATQLSSRAALCVNSSTPQLSRSSMPPFGLRISLERTASIFFMLYFFCSLRAPVLCVFTLSGSLVFFCNLSFFSMIPSVEHRHSLWLRDWVDEGNVDADF